MLFDSKNLKLAPPLDNTPELDGSKNLYRLYDILNIIPQVSSDLFQI